MWAWGLKMMKGRRLVFSSRSLSTSLLSAVEKQPNPRPFSEIPGLNGFPVVGNIPNILRNMKEKNGGDSHWFHKLHSKLGPIYKFKMLGNRWDVVISTPEAAELTFRAEGKYPSRGGHENSMMWIYKKLDSPQPMFFSKGEVWKKIRSSAGRQVVPRRVGNFVGPLCVIAEELISHLESIQDGEGNVQDISPELNKWAFQGVSYFVYGEKINIYSGTDPLQKEFMEAGLDYIRSLAIIAIALPLYKLFPTKPYRDFERIVRRMQRAGKQILTRRYVEVKDAISTGSVDETKAVGLLDQWLIEGKFTEEEALAQSYDMLAAGIDTTTSSASFLLYEIAKQPELQERLVQEITAAIGDKENPSWDDLQRMPLVRNCIKETVRLYVPTPILPRVVQEDLVLMGYQIPAGTVVLYNMNTASRDGEVFEDPREFKPDRWSKDCKEASEKPHPFSSLPFGFGPRGCYGRRLAELEMCLLLAKMLPRYRLSTNVENMKVKVELVLKPSLPLHINFHQRLM